MSRDRLARPRFASPVGSHARTPGPRLGDTGTTGLFIEGRWVERGGEQVSERGTLVRQIHRWVGSVADFPPGSVAHHLQPKTGPGLFLVRATNGTFRAYADRSPHRGQPLEYRDPLPGTVNDACGLQPGFYDPVAGA